MNRQEFMEQLEGFLTEISPAEREEALQYYNDYLDDAGEENEQEALEALGSPRLVADNIRLGLMEAADSAAGSVPDGISYGDAEAPNQTNGPDYNACEAPNQNMGSNNGSNYNPYGAPNPNMGPNNGPAYGPYYGPNQGMGYNNGPGGPAPMQNGPVRRKRSTGETILLILAGIVLLPIVVPFIIGVLITVFFLLFCLMALLFSLILGGIAVLAVGIVLSVVAFMRLMVSPAAAVYLLGGGLACTGAGLAMTVFLIWLTGKVLPPAFRGFINLCCLPFRRRKI